MRELLITAGLLLASVMSAHAQSSCTIIADARTGAVLVQNGEVCDVPFPPASTFKVPLALMGFDAGILIDAQDPAWPYRAEYGPAMQAWKVTTGPQHWLRESVVWYSRKLVAEMGADRFGAYAASLGYGNGDVSGDPGAGNGMTHSWLNSSLKISPSQQVGFLRRLLLEQLPVSVAAIRTTASIMPRFSSGDWTVWGKTGLTFERDARGRSDRSLQLGWFVGWAGKGEQVVVFASFLRDGKETPGRASYRVRDSLLANLPGLLGP